ncbi:hypothetical protein NCAS_0H03020 [Naumovozyma castellii]|uniref:CWH43-like N-terminal domain-containing protein n=1 Tax=Naumovozyma castellii TaxID=27288 RepID=G0VJD3_NAUCA|nr:hypothetical protein NCAS_0H03020 [Naumovozyma castellii CBS 4309]CCC71612.1 hypothetical protein NCAS_0H03020 [Naumovozyma castellii CBS 4309]
MNFPKPGNYWFIFPWIAFIPWYGMLITMLICWAAQGHPIYWFMHTEQFPVYISDIGATNLRPLFIACAGWQGIGYVLTVLLEYLQRSGLIKVRKERWYGMTPWFTKDERNLIWSALVLGCIGELGLLFCSIFSTARYHRVHTAMVAIFCAFMLLSIICLTAEYFLMERHYALLHPRYRASLNDEEKAVQIDELKWWQWRGYKCNKFVISAWFKTFWMVAAIIWAICFGAISDNSKSACFEWLLAFWFGVIFIILSVDFYLGSTWKTSKYFNKIDDFNGYYKYRNFPYDNAHELNLEKEFKVYHVAASVPSESSSSSVPTPPLAPTSPGDGSGEILHPNFQQNNNDNDSDNLPMVA